MKYLILAASLLAAPLARAQVLADETAANLEGLWVSENTYGPELHGDLLVTRQGAQWAASIGSAQAQARELRFEFPDEQGWFRGAQTNGGSAIEGMWMQPPGLAGQAYATPMRLERIADDTWRGEVRPLPQRFTLYLRVLRNEEGRWVGAFRNPEANFNGGASRLFATLAGDAVNFSFRFDDGREARREGVVLRDPERLSLQWPPLGDALELRRVGEEAAFAFFPRPLGAPAYAYARPPETGDGWRTARARSVGVDEAALAATVQRIIDSDPAARRPLLIHSLLVAHHGRLVLEEYFYGFDRDTPHDIRSAGKTLGSVMLGAAMRQGARLSPQTPVYEVLAGLGPFANPDLRKTDISLAQLMTHTSGLDCNDNDDESPGNEGAMQSQGEQPNWWRYTLDLPMAHDPGTRYAYCTAGINLLGAALTTATQTPVIDLFDRTIARPLQFGRYHWNLMPNSEAYLGGGAQILPRDLLKIGQLYLNGGVWRGRRIVSRAWVTQSTAPHAEINEQTTGLDAETFANTSTRGADGYGWHRYGVHVGERVVACYEANGNGGQLLIVVPEYDLAVVITGGNYGQGGIWTRWRDEIVGAQIIAAVRG